MVGRRAAAAAADAEMPDAGLPSTGAVLPPTGADAQSMLRVQDHGVVAVATTDAAALIGCARFFLPNKI